MKPGRTERIIEHVMSVWGLKASDLMMSGSWWRRAAGVALAAAALWCLVLLAFVWVLFGKKPPKAPRPPEPGLH